MNDVKPCLRPLAWALACLWAAPASWAAGPAQPGAALPSGLQVVQGQASAVLSGNRLTVNNSANALLNWQQFSIGAGNTVHFAQPDAASKVLNRVLGSDPSRIFGSLSSNGQVWLLNPNGVLFGATARVNVAGLVASTLRLGDADWQARRYHLQQGAPAGSADGLSGASVLNQGELRSTNGGRVLLVGSAGVRNEGLISAPDGQVLLAAGHSVDLVDSTLPHLALRISAPQGEVLNLGQVLAGSGRIDLNAALVNQQGIVRADSLDGRGGVLQLRASQAVALGAGSVSSASGAAGGTVVVDAGRGANLISGSVAASGHSGSGGSITLLGRQVGLLDGAWVDASGAAGGGALRAGGGLQGRDAAYPNADALYLARGARLQADALQSGDGGLIVLWSNNATRAYGSLSARGGARGGNGGFIETSGGWLDARPASLRTDAPAGRAGQWLLDPSDILITSNAQDSQISGGPDFSSSASAAVLSTQTLVAALNAGNNVSVSTAGAGSGAGDILVLNATLLATPASPVSLTLNADRNISIDGSTLRSEGAALSLNFNAGRASQRVGPGADNSQVGGAVAIRSSTISTRGGSLAIGGAVQACGAILCSAANQGAVASDGSVLRDGILVAASSLDVGNASITLNGHSVAQSGDAAGVAIIDGSTLSARDILIRGTVDADSDFSRTGVRLAGGLVSASNSLSVNGAAYSGRYSLQAPPTGVDLQGELRVGSADARNPEALLSIDGITQESLRIIDTEFPLQRRFGVGLRGASAKLVALGGAAINIRGQDRSVNGDYGILAEGSRAGYIDASAGGQLSLSALGDLGLAGDVRVPTGGLATLESSGTLGIEAASLGGDASRVQLNGATVHIGTGGASTQLVFGDSTQVQISAGQFQLGLPGGQDSPPSDTVAAGLGGNRPAQAAVAGLLPQRQALAAPVQLQALAGLPQAQALLAAGGSITLGANEVVLAEGGRLYSAAGGDAIVIRGPGSGDGESIASTNTVRFSHLAASPALSTPNGRWLVYAQDVGNSEAPFSPGTLAADFRQYDARAGSATPAAAGNGFLFAAAPVITLEGPAQRLYDGGTLFDLGALEVPLLGLREGDRISGQWHSADKNVGSAKPLQLQASGPGFEDADGKPVYGYRIDAGSLVGSITPRTLSIDAAQAASKVYDGNAAAGASTVSLRGVLEGDRVSGQASGNFDSKDVGSEKSVRLDSFVLAGVDAGNYRIDSETASVSSLAAITPATLLYVADRISLPLGSPLPALGGTVTGFVGEESLASATRGELAFSSPLARTDVAGRYAVLGSGLQADNYVLEQAPGNADALRVQATQALVPPQEINTSTRLALARVLLLPQASSATRGRTLDVFQAVQADASADRSAFASLDLASMSQEAVAAVLAARDQYKKAIFQPAIQQLELNPAAADALVCANAQQAASGQCLLLAALPERGLLISNARVVELAPPTLPPGPGVAPAAPTAAAPAVAPAVAPPAAAAGAAPGPATPATAGTPPAVPASVAAIATTAATPAFSLPARRGIKSAALPQIQRKIALLIGIDRYADARIPGLANAVGDARAMAAALEARLGYETVVLENADRAAIFRALNRLSSEVGPADSVVLYYAGHGELIEKTGVGYWQPADADPTRPETWIANTDIDRVLRQLPASQLAMISDSCFSGGLVTGERIRGISGTLDPALLLGRRAAVVMTSGGNEPVSDSGQNGHSPFANSLMQSLAQVPGWKPGSSLFEQVRFAVARQLPQRPQYGASRDAGHETGTDYLFEQRQLEGRGP